MTNKIIQGKEAVIVDHAVDYVKKQGYTVIPPEAKFVLACITAMIVFIAVGNVASAALYDDCSIYGNCRNATALTSSSVVNASNVSHNALAGLQGGDGVNYYHLGLAQYNNLSYLHDWSVNVPTPGGGEGDIQFNNGGSFAGLPQLHFDSGNILFGISQAGNPPDAQGFFDDVGGNTGLVSRINYFDGSYLYGLATDGDIKSSGFYHPKVWVSDSGNPADTSASFAVRSHTGNTEERLAMFEATQAAQRGEFTLTQSSQGAGWTDNFLSLMIHPTDYGATYYTDDDAGAAILLGQGGFLRKLAIATYNGQPISIWPGAGNRVALFSSGGNSFVQSNFTGVLDMLGNGIINVPTPSSGTDAANKDYVDSRPVFNGSYVTYESQANNVNMSGKNITNIGSLGVNRTATIRKLAVVNATNNGNDRCTLVAGSCTIANTQVTAGTNIFCQVQVSAGTLGSGIYISGRNAGVNYTVTDLGGTLDTSTVGCLLVQPGVSI